MGGLLLLLRFKWPMGHTGFCLVIFFFWLYCVTLGILVPWPEAEPGTLTVKVQSPSHWPTGGFPALWFLNVNVLELVVPVSASCVRFNPVQRIARWYQGTLPPAFYFEIFQKNLKKNGAVISKYPLLCDISLIFVLWNLESNDISLPMFIFLPKSTFS